MTGISTLMLSSATGEATWPAYETVASRESVPASRIRGTVTVPEAVPGSETPSTCSTTMGRPPCGVSVIRNGPTGPGVVRVTTQRTSRGAPTVATPTAARPVIARLGGAARSSFATVSAFHSSSVRAGRGMAEIVAAWRTAAR